MMSIFVWLSTDHIVLTLATIPVFTSPPPAGCYLLDYNCVFVMAVWIDTLCLIAGVYLLWLS